MIANNQPELCCRQVWIPIMMHVLEIRVNAYIIHNSFVKDNYRLKAKHFILTVVKKLQQRAVTLTYKLTRSIHEKTTSEVTICSKAK